MIKVILLIDCASEFDRRLLRGMIRYSKENDSWLFYRIPSNLQNGVSREDIAVDWAKKWNADAIIGRWDEGKLDRLESLNIPVVLQNNRCRSDVYSNLTGDYIGTGRLAAQYFRQKLYTDYAFFGVKNVIWSEERCKGFREEVLEDNGRFYSYEEAPVIGDDRQKIIEWLTGLPKPLALFCCDDSHALFMTETCRMAGIRVPEDISILGVDDDDLLCEISDPPISSIELEVERGGYMACKLLHDRIRSKDKSPFNVTIKPLGVRERTSTLIHNIKDKEVLKIVKFMESHYQSDIKMSNLLQLVPLSRRSIEMRFKRATDMTVYQYLLHLRVEHLAYLLSTTDQPLIDIAFNAGFNDFNNVSRTFKKYKGCSPLEYRRKYCVI